MKRGSMVEQKEKMKSHLSVDISNISLASFGSLSTISPASFGCLYKFMKVFLHTLDARNILQVLKLLFFEVLLTRYRDLFSSALVRCTFVI